MPEENSGVSPSKRVGQKAMRNQPIFYKEKKRRIQLTLTPTAIEILENMASAANESKSQWLEMHLRGIKNL